MKPNESIEREARYAPAPHAGRYAGEKLIHKTEEVLL